MMKKKPMNRPTLPAMAVARRRLSVGAPHDGAKHPAAVEWKAGNQVKDHQREIDESQVAHQGEQRNQARRQRLQEREEHRQRKTHRGPGDGDPKLGLGAGRLRADLGDAAENEQGDTADGDLIAQGYNRMPQFVQQHAHEEHNRRDRADYPILRRRPALELLRKIALRQRPGEQHKDQEPGVVQPDGDADNASQGNHVPVHDVPPHCQSQISGMSSPCFATYCL